MSRLSHYSIIPSHSNMEKCLGAIVISHCQTPPGSWFHSALDFLSSNIPSFGQRLSLDLPEPARWTPWLPKHINAHRCASCCFQKNIHNLSHSHHFASWMLRNASQASAFQNLSSFDLLKNLRPRSATCSGTWARWKWLWRDRQIGPHSMPLKPQILNLHDLGKFGLRQQMSRRFARAPLVNWLKTWRDISRAEPMIEGAGEQQVGDKSSMKNQKDLFSHL